jgi:hypothetical protein
MTWTVEQSVPPGMGPNPPQRVSQAWDFYIVQSNQSDQVIFSGPGVYGGYSVLSVAGGACPISHHDGIASTGQQIGPNIDGNALGNAIEAAGKRVVNGLTIKASTTNPAAPAAGIGGVLIWFRAGGG